MPAGLVAGQTASATGSGTQISAFFPATETAGNSVICTTAADSTGANFENFSDDFANIYAIDKRHNHDGTFNVVAQGSTHGIPANSGNGHNATYTSSAGLALIIAEYTGLTGAISGTPATGGLSTGTAWATGSVTTTAADCVLISSGSAQPQGRTFVPLQSFIEVLDISGPFRQCQQQYKVVSATGTYTSTATLSASADWLGVLVAYVASAGIGTQDQEGFRWRNDDGSETTATWKAAQDVNLTAPITTTKRLRMLVNTTNDVAAGQYQLEYRKVGDPDWRKVTS